MSDVDPVVTTDPDPIDPENPAEPAPSVENPPEGGDKADLVKDLVEQRKAWRAEKATLKTKLEALEAEVANKDKPAEEQALEQARREAREEAQNAFNQRLVQAELKAALAGKVNNPALALRVIDASEIDVDASGEVDPQSVTDAIDAALSQYPELKPVDQKKFAGTADQGAKGKPSRPHQLSREELAALSPDARVKAHEAGQLDDLLAGKG
jgi:hypothetical protein